MRISEALNKLIDTALAYRPKPKTKAAKKRARRNKRNATKGLQESGKPTPTKSRELKL
jgi:hypothetical protein